MQGVGVGKTRCIEMQLCVICFRLNLLEGDLGARQFKISCALFAAREKGGVPADAGPQSTYINHPCLACLH